MNTKQKTKRMVVTGLILFMSLIFTVAHAEVKLPTVLSSNMVLQRDIPLNIWGWAKPGEKVSVSFNGQNLNAVALADGTWKVTLKPMKAGGAFDMDIKGQNTITLKNILIGDVWVCAGQSNMDMRLIESKDGKEDVANANCPSIRLFCVPRNFSERVLDNTAPSEWKECTPQSVENFTAVGFLFGKDIQPKIGVPVGLIQASVGGTLAENWTDVQTMYDLLMSENRIEDMLVKTALFPEVPGTNINKYSALLYNGMIAPIINYGIKGVVWYQGESNATRATHYCSQIKALVNAWRKNWNQGDFPFLLVQIANYDSKGTPDDGDWALLRESQTMASKDLKNFGMAVTIDIGESHDVHPKNKREVGRRLSLIALEKVYKQNVKSGSPLYKSMSIKNGKATIKLEHTYGNLVAKGNTTGEVFEFEVAGADKEFHPAKAFVEKNFVVVECPEVQNPVAVRYAWKNDPCQANLYNSEGLPASPFRTDKWLLK